MMTYFRRLTILYQCSRSTTLSSNFPPSAALTAIAHDKAGSAVSPAYFSCCFLSRGNIPMTSMEMSTVGKPEVSKET